MFRWLMVMMMMIKILLMVMMMTIKIMLMVMKIMIIHYDTRKTLSVSEFRAEATVLREQGLTKSIIHSCLKVERKLSLMPFKSF